MKPIRVLGHQLSALETVLVYASVVVFVVMLVYAVGTNAYRRGAIEQFNRDLVKTASAQESGSDTHVARALVDDIASRYSVSSPHVASELMGLHERLDRMGIEHDLRAIITMLQEASPSITRASNFDGVMQSYEKLRVNNGHHAAADMIVHASDYPRR